MMSFAPTSRGRRGLTLFEMVATLALLAILSTVIVVNVEANSRPGGDTARIDHAAAGLARLSDAIARYNLGERGDTSFTWKISGIANKHGGVYPASLSELTNKISGTSLNSCGGQIGATLASGWTRHFFMRYIAPGGTLKIAEGFVANDQLQRFNTDGTASTVTSSTTVPGTLAIVMQNVALSDAEALALRMEGDQSGGHLSVVRFTANGTAPVTVYYHIAIHGC